MSNLLLQNILSLNDTQLKDWAENKFSIINLYRQYYPNSELDLISWLKQQKISRIETHVPNTTQMRWLGHDAYYIEQYYLQVIEFSTKDEEYVNTLSDHEGVVGVDFDCLPWTEDLYVKLEYQGELNLVQELFNV